METEDQGITLTGRGSTREASLFSPDSSTHVYVKPNLKGIEGAETLAHELYGHAWTYLMGKTPWNHIREWIVTNRNSGIEIERIHKETSLEKRIRIVENAAKDNYTN